MNHTSTPLADPERDVLAEVVDTGRHHLTEDVATWRALGHELSGQLARDGIAKLPGFLRPSAVDAIADEFDRLRSWVPMVHDRRSVYAGSTAGPEHGHPALNVESEWVAGHITRDMIPPQSPAHRLYVSPMFKQLVAACVAAEQLFEYADPLAGLVATVLAPGGCYGWHYDTNEYVVTVSICDAEQGGDFEYCRDLRRPGDENLDGLAAVLSGADRASVSSASTSPGDLQVFRGRYSLHRVTPVAGARHRVVLVLSYSDRAGVIGPIDRTRRVYGRVTEAHLVAGSARCGADGLIL